jgi:hypothetical protein
VKSFIVQWQRPIAASAVTSALLLSMALGGWRGLAGMAIGISGTWVNAWILWQAVTAFGNHMGDTPQSSRRARFATVGFLLKLPILVGLGLLARMIGGAALPCFVAGLGMVYFGLVGWARAHT